VLCVFLTIVLCVVGHTGALYDLGVVHFQGAAGEEGHSVARNWTLAGQWWKRAVMSSGSKDMRDAASAALKKLAYTPYLVCRAVTFVAVPSSLLAASCPCSQPSCRVRVSGWSESRAGSGRQPTPRPQAREPRRTPTRRPPAPGERMSLRWKSRQQCRSFRWPRQQCRSL
jgi:hypothetical protein